MNKNKKPLMSAYIVFLLICVIYYLASIVFKFEFQEWNRIVAAVTISSYFFSMSSFYKYDFEMTKKEQKHFEKYLKPFEKAKSIVAICNSIPDLDETIDMIKAKIVKCENKVSRYSKLTYFLDVVGYICFFSILCIEPLFNGLKSMQELYTVLAFFFILMLEQKKNNIDDKHEKNMQIADDKATIVLTKLEDTNNGQIKNALDK